MDGILHLDNNIDAKWVSVK